MGMAMMIWKTQKEKKEGYDSKYGDLTSTFKTSLDDDDDQNSHATMLF